jgi:hypothetical protein
MNNALAAPAAAASRSEFIRASSACRPTSGTPATKASGAGNEPPPAPSQTNSYISTGTSKPRSTRSPTKRSSQANRSPHRRTAESLTSTEPPVASAHNRPASVATAPNQPSALAHHVPAARPDPQTQVAAPRRQDVGPAGTWPRSSSSEPRHSRNQCPATRVRKRGPACPSRHPRSAVRGCTSDR